MQNLFEMYMCLIWSFTESIDLPTTGFALQIEFLIESTIGRSLYRKFLIELTIGRLGICDRLSFIAAIGTMGRQELDTDEFVFGELITA